MNIKRALISVYNKTGIINFCNELTNFGIEISATMGTLTLLKEGGIKKIKHVSNVTNYHHWILFPASFLLSQYLTLQIEMH